MTAEKHDVNIVTNALGHPEVTARFGGVSMKRELIIAPRTGAALELKQGERLKVVDLEGFLYGNDIIGLQELARN